MFRSFPRATAMAIALALVALCARAHDFKLGDLLVDHPIAYATPASARTGAAYFTIVNRGAAADRLLSASTPAAGKAELHATIRDGDVMRMREVRRIEIAPGGKAVLQRGGTHVMLVDLAAPLKAGDRFALTLVFERAGAVEVVVLVEAQRGAAPAHGEHAH